MNELCLLHLSSCASLFVCVSLCLSVCLSLYLSVSPPVPDRAGNSRILPPRGERRELTCDKMRGERHRHGGALRGPLSLHFSRNSLKMGSQGCGGLSFLGN